MEGIWIALVVVAGVAGIIVFLARWDRRREEQLESVWRAFAERNGLEWHPTTGSWWNRKLGYVSGTVDGVPVTLERFYVRRGKHRELWTRLCSTLPRPLSERVLVGRRRWTERLHGAFRGPIVDVGVTSFDDAWLVRSRSRDVARELLRDGVRGALSEFPREPRIEAEGSNLRFSWRHGETDPTALSRGLAVVVAASAR